jgi:CheY-like chemotaxis protein
MISCCFHPTQVVVIDDNIEFLRNLNQILSKDYSSYLFYKNPQKALHYLNEIYKSDPFPNRYIENIDEEKWEHRRLDVNIFDTHHEIYRPERFEEISTVIIDHSMPGMSGLQLCKQIKNSYIQKILLTGVADEHIAIRAFNEGLIHHYIRKQDLDMTEQLNEAVEKAQWRYFNKLSEVTIKAITADSLVNHALVDPSFQNLFKKILKRYVFKEAYLCETMGSYLFLTDEGSVHGLVVNNADQLEVSWESGEALNVDSSILNELRSRKKIMFYHNRQGIFEPKAKDWKNHIYTAHVLKGEQETYYYAIAPNMFDIEMPRILPFGEYKAGKIFEVHY